jgi:carbon-monoxide dehydrogenase medium subunit
MSNPTGYYRPRTVDEAVRLLTQTHISTALLSGGALRLTAANEPEYEALVDVQEIEGLSAIVTGKDGGLQMGAAASLEMILRHGGVPALLRQTLQRTLTWNRRNAVSIAEAIEYPGRAAELVGALLALRATVVFAAPDEISVSLMDLVSGAMPPNLTPRRLILRVELPAQGPWTTWGSAWVARTPADSAIVGATAVIETDQAGIVLEAYLALSGVWGIPARIAEQASSALVGGALNETRIAAAVEALGLEIAPQADYQGSVEYRREMAGVLTRRALDQCLARLSG